MLLNWRRASWVLPFLGLSFGGCQVLSGLNDIGVLGQDGAGGGSVASSASAGSTGSTGSGSNSSSSSGGGSGGAGGGDVGPTCVPGGGPCPELFMDTAPTRVDYLAIRGGVVWASQGTNSTTGEVWTASLSGAGPHLLATPTKVAGLAASDTDVYWIDKGASNDAVSYVALAGGSPASFAPQATAASGLTLDGSLLYWAGTFKSGGQLIRSVTLPQNTVSDVANKYIGVPQVIAFDTDSIYWAGIKNAGIYAVLKKLKSAPPDAVVTVANESTSVFGVALGPSAAAPDDNLYWTQNVEKGAGGAIRMAQKSAVESEGAPFEAGLDYPTYIIASATHVYWVEGIATCPGSGGKAKIRRKMFDGSASAETLMVNAPCPSNFVRFDGYIYFGIGDKIFRVAE